MTAFDARGVEKAGIVAYQAAAGKVSAGSDCNPPAEIARAPYATRLPPSRNGLIAGWVL